MSKKYHRVIVIIEAESLAGLARGLIWHAEQILSVATGRITQKMWSTSIWGGANNSLRKYYCDTKKMKSPMGKETTLTLRRILGNPKTHVPPLVEIKTPEKRWRP